MSGTGAAALLAPAALGYALHAARRAADRGFGWSAVVLAGLDTLCVLALVGLWIGSILG